MAVLSRLSIVLLASSGLAAQPSPSAANGVCDIYLKGGTPCVAAHSMTRALYQAFDGALYRLVKAPDNTTADIRVKSAGGTADAAAHDAFCGSSSACVVQAIYDQSPMQNHLGLEGPAQRGHNINPLRNIQDLGVNFTDPRSKATLGGQPVFAAFFAGAPGGYDGKPFIGQGYSNRSARGTAQGDEPETMYAVMGNPKEPISGRGNCCFDYGNAERWNASGTKCVDGTMEAIYVVSLVWLMPGGPPPTPPPHLYVPPDRTNSHPHACRVAAAASVARTHWWARTLRTGFTASSRPR
jgi:hypothetical protein